ncbi:MAG: malic enzyme-like NAD(P)-binding protein [Pseudomonadota bacterium]
MSELEKNALAYHQFPQAGKIATQITKPTETEGDLALAYTPGVAVPVLKIAENPDDAYLYTNKGNLVAVITDGTAVLGLGNVGPLAGKPVMEGKAVLFKRFANVDVFDISVASPSAEAFIETVTQIAPTFGGINLEDIRGPECFGIEEALIEKLDIPVFHDDQHGTAIVVAAGILNALEIQEKNLHDVRIVCLGAGAAGIASMKLLIALGVPKAHILMVDRQGVIYDGRTDLSTYKAEFAHDTTARTLDDAMKDADVFIGVSGANLVTAAQIASMAPKPIVFALSNPNPEIDPALARSVRDDLILATGRSDYPNQVNNVLCFPYIFRGALDVRARCINEAMKVAAVMGIRKLAKLPILDSVRRAYKRELASGFGVDYILPTPLDPRLLEIVPALVAQAAIDSGVARLPYPAHYPKVENGE